MVIRNFTFVRLSLRRFCDEMQHSLLQTYGHFRRKYYLQLQGKKYGEWNDDVGSKFP